MNVPINRFKLELRNGRKVIGLWSQLASNQTVEIIASAGFDWILLDTEHSPVDLENLLRQLQAAAAYPAHPIVRVPWNDMVIIKRVLDIGAQSLLIPFISNAQEAREAVRHTRYPPAGVRGVASATRASRFGRIKDYAKLADDQMCVLVQVETREALARIEEICAVDGVDGVFIGPGDLHASMGLKGETANPAVKSLIDEGIRRIATTGKAAGILTSNEADARHWLGCGATFVAVGADVGILAREADALASRFRSHRQG